MVSLSITAPRTTEDELNAERALLSQEQLQLDHAELYGGQAAAIAETDEMVVWTLQQVLERVVSEAQQTTTSTPVQQAMQHCPEYLMSQEFLLMFLRAERFDVELALTRIRQYWKTKIELFGDNAFHPLSAHDLSAQDMECLQLGGLIILPGKDRAGRALLFSDRSKWEFRSTHRTSFARAYWFAIHQALLDVETQKKGIVLIVYNSQPFTASQFDRKTSNLIVGGTFHVLPVRLAATHLTIQSRVFNLVLPFIFWAMGKEARRKFFHHMGSKALILEQLGTDFGIPTSHLPREFGGTLDFDYGRWVAETLWAQGIAFTPTPGAI